MPTPNATHRPASPLVDYDTWCVTCGYNLVRLPKNGDCPTCRTPIETTLSSNLISESSPEYVEALRKGVSLVLNSILIQVCAGVVMVGIAMAISIANGIPSAQPSTPFQPPPMPLWWTLTFGFVFLCTQAMNLTGLWLFTTHDPAFSGRNDATSSRSWIRNLILASIPLYIVQFVVQQVTTNLLITIVFGVIGLAVWVPLACTQMAYVQWLAPRLPDARVGTRAKLMIWLYPVLSTVGALACVGPLVGLVMYWNLLNWVRQDLRYLQELRVYEGSTTYSNES